MNPKTEVGAGGGLSSWHGMLDSSKRYDVIRVLADAESYVMLGRNLSAADAAELRAFHQPMDRKYAGAAAIREHRPTREGGAA